VSTTTESPKGRHNPAGAIRLGKAARTLRLTPSLGPTDFRYAVAAWLDVCQKATLAAQQACGGIDTIPEVVAVVQQIEAAAGEQR
jgi:hypothetical protein